MSHNSEKYPDPGFSLGKMSTKTIFNEWVSVVSQCSVFKVLYLIKVNKYPRTSFKKKKIAGKSGFLCHCQEQ